MENVPNRPYSCLLEFGLLDFGIVSTFDIRISELVIKDWGVVKR